MRFVDTSILLYSVSSAPEEARKTEAAIELLAGSDLCLSVQVLQEFYVQATRASRNGALAHEDALAFVERWLRFPVQEMTVPLMRAASAARVRWGLPYWDAAVIEAARLQGCTEVISEDFTAGQDYGGVLVVNPFG